MVPIYPKYVYWCISKVKKEMDNHHEIRIFFEVRK